MKPLAYEDEIEEVLGVHMRTSVRLQQISDASPQIQAVISSCVSHALKAYYRTLANEFKDFNADLHELCVGAVKDITESLPSTGAPLCKTN